MKISGIRVGKFESLICTPKPDDKHPRPFHMGEGGGGREGSHMKRSGIRVGNFESLICTPKPDDKYPRPFHMAVTPGIYLEHNNELERVSMIHVSAKSLHVYDNIACENHIYH